MNNINYCNKVLTIELIRSEPGLESKIVEKHTNKSSFIYLGDFDLAILSIGESREIKSPISYNNILDYASFEAHFIGCQETLEDSVIKASNILTNAKIVTIVLCQYSPDVKPDQIYNGFCHIHEVEYDGIDIVPLRGFGKSELILLLGSDNIQHIQGLISHIRNKFSPNVISTSSSVLLPYLVANEKNEFKQIWGETHADIKIICHPGYEQKILKSINTNRKFTPMEIIGEDDIAISTNEPVELSNIAEFALGIRENTDGGIYGTSTQLKWMRPSHENALAENGSKGASDYRKQMLSRVSNIYSEVEKIKEAIAQIGPENEEYIVHLKNYHEIGQFLIRVTSVLFDPASVRTAEAFVNYLCEVYLEIIKAYKTDIANNRRGTNYFHLKQVSEWISSALTQRLVSAEGLKLRGYSLPTGFYNGANVIFEAASILIANVYSSLCRIGLRHKKVSDKWVGFVRISQEHNFNYSTGQVYTLPGEALENICNKNSSWLPITHEISHAIWFENDLNIYPIYLKANNTGEINVTTLDDFLYNIKDNDSDQKEKKRILLELFAHWFDLRHFYGDNLDQYMLHTWSSILSIPKVQSNIPEYAARMFMMFVSKYFRKDTPSAMLSLLNLEREYDHMLNKLVELDVLQEKGHIYKSLRNADVINGAYKLVNNYAAIIRLFEGAFFSEKFKGIVSYNEDRDGAIVSQIADGTPVKGLSNLLPVLFGCACRAHTRCGFENKGQFAFLESVRLSSLNCNSPQ